MTLKSFFGNYALQQFRLSGSAPWSTNVREFLSSQSIGPELCRNQYCECKGYLYCPIWGKGDAIKEETSVYKGQIERTSRKNVAKVMTCS